MAEAAETIITRFVLEASEMLKGTMQIREQIDKTKVALKAAAEANKESFKVTAAGMKEAFRAANTWTDSMGRVKKNSKEIRQFNLVMAHSLREVEQEERKAAKAIKERAREQERAAKATKKSAQSTKEATTSNRIFGIELGKLGDIGRLVFGSILGITGITVLRDLVGWFTQAIEKGEEFAISLFKLGAGTRALQKQGLDLTIADVTEKIERLRKEFGIFSRKELVDGIGQVQLYTRQLGFSVEQMDQMTDAIATLAIVMGKDFGETARSVALFLSSGYGEALQRAGIVDANRATVAQELLALGFNKSFNEATQQERALAGLNILLRGTADLSGEVANFQDSMAGKIRLANAEIESRRELIGQKLLPLEILWLRLQLEAIDAYVSLVGAINKVGFAIRFAFQAPIEALIEIFKQLRDGTFELTNLINLLGDSFERTGEKLREAFLIDLFDLSETYEDLGKDIAKGISKGLEEGLEVDVTPFFDELADEIEKEGEKLQNRLDAIGRDVANDLERIGRNATNSIADIWADYSNKITDIITKMEQKIADAIRRAALQRAQILRQAQLRREEIDRKYRERELKAERDFQEAMRRLREDFLLDLEDALRERDALQVLRLTKRFNLEQERLRRERADERGDLERQRKQELQDLERQTQERLRVLQEELQARIEAIRIAADREREQAFIEAQRRIEEERIAEERRKKEREIRAEEQKIEEEKRSKERLEAWAKELADRRGLTETEIELLLQALQDTYGEGGPVQGILEGLGGVLVEINEEIAESLEEIRRAYLRAIAHVRALNNMSVSSPNQPTSSPGGGGFQEGGTVLANKPTTVTFGEAGLEAATFTPLTRIGKNEGEIFTDLAPVQDGGRSGFGKLALEIMLSRGLEANIIESALDEVADVIVNVQRKR